jgi:hypothetical protein
MHYSFNTQPTYPLYCMEQKLFTRVRFWLYTTISLFRQYHDRQLFGEDEDAGGELDEAEQQGENGIRNH